MLQEALRTPSNRVLEVGGELWSVCLQSRLAPGRRMTRSLKGRESRVFYANTVGYDGTRVDS